MFSRTVPSSSHNAGQADDPDRLQQLRQGRRSGASTIKATDTRRSASSTTDSGPESMRAAGHIRCMSLRRWEGERPASSPPRPAGQGAHRMVRTATESLVFSLSRGARGERPQAPRRRREGDPRARTLRCHQGEGEGTVPPVPEEGEGGRTSLRRCDSAAWQDKPRLK